MRGGDISAIIHEDYAITMSTGLFFHAEGWLIQFVQFNTLKINIPLHVSILTFFQSERLLEDGNGATSCEHR